MEGLAKTRGTLQAGGTPRYPGGGTGPSQQQSRTNNARMAQAYIHSYKKLQNRINKRKGDITKYQRGSNPNTAQLQNAQRELQQLQNQQNKLVSKAWKKLGIDIRRY